MVIVIPKIRCYSLSRKNVKKIQSHGVSKKKKKIQSHALNGNVNNFHLKSNPKYILKGSYTMISSNYKVLFYFKII